eukprot:768640-Hanusia_phi.AAC.10
MVGVVYAGVEVVAWGGVRYSNGYLFLKTFLVYEGGGGSQYRRYVIAQRWVLKAFGAGREMKSKGAKKICEFSSGEG